MRDPRVDRERWDRALARRIRGPLVRAFDLTPERRAKLVQSMVHPELGDRPMYWLRLLLATGIATLGLVLGSTAVVIGAMLISPLITPIVELGMGIAIGLPALTLRSFARVGTSCIAVSSVATAITAVLPFQEVTPAIAERASPTLLDLSIAILCALMAAFGTIAGTAGAATPAAGTAIGIALVPPICVTGFGLGAGRLDIASGAALLFIANFSAIMLFSVLTFVALGFSDLDAKAVNQPGKRIAPLWRVILPAVLLAMVFVPLQRALDEVAWEVAARAIVRRELAAIERETIRSQLRIARRRIDLEILIIGESARARRLERELAQRIQDGSGGQASVSILALPDAEAVSRERERERHGVAAPVGAPPPPVSQQTATAITRAWPESGAGELVGWRTSLGDGPGVQVHVAHLGPELGQAGRELLARTLEPSFGARVVIVDHAFPRQPMTCTRPLDGACFGRVRALIEDARDWSKLHVCATRPVAEPRGGDGGSDGGLDSEAGALIAAALARLDGRSRLSPGEAWSILVRAEPCVGDDPADAPATADAAGDGATGDAGP